MPTITEAQLRQMVANQINQWMGATKGSPMHKKIIDTYNSFPAVANTPGSYKMTYNDHWCACTVSVTVMLLGLYPYTGFDVSCTSWVSKAQSKGIWVENEATYMPKVGDFQLYSWSDNSNYARTDLTKTPNHIGIVTEVSGTNYKVTEGNKGNASVVGVRSLVKNSQYSRGFITPDYAAMAKLINEGKLAFPEIRPDGGYNNGYLTPAQVREMQKHYGLSVDGCWGPGSQKAQGSAIDAWCRYKGIPNDSKPTSYKVGYSNEETIYNFMTSVMKLNTAGACGVLANIRQESNFNPTVYGDRNTSYGICQWHGSRFTDLKNYCSKNGLDYKTLDGQLWFLKYELEYKYSDMLRNLRAVQNNANGAYSAGAEWCKSFERPSNVSVLANERGNYAKNTLWPKYSATPASSGTTTSSYAKQNPYPVPTRTLKQGYKGSDVKWLQWMLFQLKFSTAGQSMNQFVDGSFGPGTTKSLKSFQATYGLAVDGSCGPATRTKLLSL